MDVDLSIIDSYRCLQCFCKVAHVIWLARDYYQRDDDQQSADGSTAKYSQFLKRSEDQKSQAFMNLFHSTHTVASVWKFTWSCSTGTWITFQITRYCALETRWDILFYFK